MLVRRRLEPNGTRSQTDEKTSSPYHGLKIKNCVPNVSLCWVLCACINYIIIYIYIYIYLYLYTYIYIYIYIIYMNASVNLKNVPIYYIGLSFAKVLLKPWRKTAFIWRLGGLNCGLAKASLQEYCSLGVEVSELADEGEQGPKYYAKASNLNVQHCAATTEKLRWLICPRSCSILAWCTAKVKHGYGES